MQTRPPPADDDMSPWAVIRRLTDFDTKGPASLQTKFFESLILIMAGYGKILGRARNPAKGFASLDSGPNRRILGSYHSR